jgi:hypothetical protein
VKTHAHQQPRWVAGWWCVGAGRRKEGKWQGVQGYLYELSCGALAQKLSGTYSALPCCLSTSAAASLHMTRVLPVTSMRCR